jgi:hypothetical protein
MSEAYYYHAPDSRVYGPADRATLERWLKEGRVLPSSRVSRQGREGFLTVEEVLRQPPEPEPIAPEAPPLVEAHPAEGELGEKVKAPTAQQPAEAWVPENFLGVVQGGFTFFEKSFLPYLGMGVLMQVPVVLFSLGLRLAASFGEKGPAVVLGTLVGALLTGLSIEIFSAPVLHYTWQQATGAMAPSWGRAWKVTGERIDKIIVTYFLRAGVLILFALITGLLAALASYALGRMPGIGRFLVSLLILLCIVAFVLFALRLALSPAAVMIEGLKGMAALRRSAELFMVCPFRGVLQRGEVQFLFLLGFCGVLAGTLTLAAWLLVAGSTGQSFASLLSQVMAGKDPNLAALSVLVRSLADVLVLPLYMIYSALFFLYLRRRLEHSRQSLGAVEEELSS